MDNEQTKCDDVVQRLLPLHDKYFPFDNLVHLVTPLSILLVWISVLAFLVLVLIFLCSLVPESKYRLCTHLAGPSDHGRLP